MDTKAFAVGEVLTAQDVNEYLGNDSRTYSLTGSAVFIPTDSAQIGQEGVHALVTEYASGFKSITLQLVLAVNPQDLKDRTNLGSVTEALRTIASVPLTGFVNVAGAIASLSPNGVIAGRWTSSTETVTRSLALGGTYFGAP